METDIGWEITVKVKNRFNKYMIFLGAKCELIEMDYFQM